ncbi:unnamed protein product, partial [Choristocarpus tenellus]
AFHEDEGAKVYSVVSRERVQLKLFEKMRYPNMEWAGGVVLLFVSIWFADLFLLSMRLG